MRIKNTQNSILNGSLIKKKLNTYIVIVTYFLCPNIQIQTVLQFNYCHIG